MPSLVLLVDSRQRLLGHGASYLHRSPFGPAVRTFMARRSWILHRWRPLGHDRPTVTASKSARPAGCDPPNPDWAALPGVHFSYEISSKDFGSLA
jgi:hypothetical protein